MRLKIVLDTNAIISALGRKSPFKIVINKLLEDKYDLFVTTDILLEYEEKIAELHNPQLAETFLDFLSILPNVLLKLGFPKVNLLKIKEFTELLESL